MFVVLIAEASHPLAGHLDGGTLVEFLVVFSLIWAFWFNGALSHEVLGRDDGRSRTSLFAQMLLLIIVAAFTDEAVHGDVTGFVVVGTSVLVLQAGVWLSGARQNDDNHTGALARTFAAGSAALAAVLLASLAVGETARVVLWSIGLTAGIVAPLVVEQLRPSSLRITARTAHRMVERFGLITIVVLGEIVFGVVNGFSRAADSGLDTLLTGLFGLWIAFALWWNFFDFVGRTTPKAGSVAPWISTHLPIAAGMAAIGAATTQLTVDEPESRPAAIWLLTGSVVTVLVAMAVRERTLDNQPAHESVQRRFLVATITGGLAVLAIGALQPAVWVAMGLVITVLIVIWLVTFEAWIRHADTLETIS